jgi:hypothetical protein
MHYIISEDTKQEKPNKVLNHSSPTIVMLFCQAICEVVHFFHSILSNIDFGPFSLNSERELLQIINHNIGNNLPEKY